MVVKHVFSDVSTHLLPCQTRGLEDGNVYLYTLGFLFCLCEILNGLSQAIERSNDQMSAI